MINKLPEHATSGDDTHCVRPREVSNRAPEPMSVVEE